jgi:hypothetical protein
LRVALEHDSTGRHRLEHVRIRTGLLPALGPHDIVTSSVTKKTYERIIKDLRASWRAAGATCQGTTGFGVAVGCNLRAAIGAVPFVCHRPPGR